jgi:hypothetical protein
MHPGRTFGGPHPPGLHGDSTLAELILVVAGIRPDGSGIQLDEGGITLMRADRLQQAQIAHENALELRAIPTAVEREFTRFPQDAVFMDEQGDERTVVRGLIQFHQATKDDTLVSGLYQSCRAAIANSAQLII